MEEEELQAEEGTLLGNYYNRISSETGLPKKQIEQVDPNTMLGAAFLRTKDPKYLANFGGTPNPDYNPLATSAGTIDLTNAYPEPLANYRDYNVPLSPFADLNDERAKRQGTFEKWVHGLTKAGITVGTAFAENTVGLIAGLGNLAFGENHSFYDNPFGRAMDQINEAAREALPNYYTKAEQEASLVGDGWGSGLLSANFWADKVAGGAAYTVGSIASMFVGTGEAALIAKLAGIGKYGKLAGVLNKLDKVDELADGIGVGVRSNKSAAYQAAKLVSTGGDAADVVAQTGKLSRVANMKVGARNLTIATQMSLAESSMEARETKNRFKEERIAEWEQTTGLDRNQMDQDTLNAIEASAAAAGNLSFGINLPILMASNMFIFRNMFKTGKPIAESVSNKVTREATGTWVQQAAKTGFGRAYAKADRLFGKTVTGIVTEGFQEGTQFLASEMSRRYYADKYQDGVGDMVSAFNYGLDQTLGTKEGLENIFIGALIGGGTGTISRMFGADKKFQTEKDANTQKLLTLLNNGGLTKALENLDSTEQILYTNMLAEAASKGNYMFADRIRNRLILGVTNQFRKLGGLDAAFEQLEDMKSFTEQEFKERWGYDMSKSLKDQTGKTQLELIEEVKTKMENYTKVSENIESIIAERQIPQQVIPRVIDSLFQTPEIKNAKVLQNKVFSTYANMLLNRIIDIDSIDESISDRYEKLVQLVPGLGAFSKEDFEFGVKVGEFTFKDGKVELSKDITQEGKDKESEKNKRVKKLQEIKEVINGFMEIGRADLAGQATQIFNELQVLMSDRTVVNTALKRMNASPNEIAKILEEELLEQFRESAVSQINNANTVLENAESTSDIDSGIPNIDNLPSNIRNKVKKKWLELWNEETKLVSKYLSLSEEDFNAIDVDKLSNKEKAAYDRAKSRKEVTAEVLKTEQAESKTIPVSEENPTEVNGNTVSYEDVLTDAEMQAFGDIVFIRSNNNTAVKVGENQFAWVDPGIYFKIDGKEYANLEEDSLDAIRYNPETGEPVSITLTDMSTGNKVTWSIQTGEDLNATQIKDNARANALIYFTYAKAASVIPITSTEQATQIQENLKTGQQVLTEEFTELTGEKVVASKEELEQYALDNIEKTKNLSDSQLRIQVEELKKMIADISSQIEGFIKLGESQFGDRKSAEQYYAGDLRDLRALNKRLKNYLANKINVLKNRKSIQKAAVVGGENVKTETEEILELTSDDIDYLIQNAQNEINDLNEQLTKLNRRIDSYELIEGSLKSLNSLNKLKKDVQVIEAKIKKRENLISNLNETRESQKRPKDSDTTERPGQPTEGQGPEATDLPTAEAPKTEGVPITSVNLNEIQTVVSQAAEAADVIVVTPGTQLPIIPREDESTGEVMLSPEELDITIAKTTTKGTLEFKDIVRQTQTVNGEEIPIIPDYEALSSSDITPSNPDMKVRFEVREDTDYWQKQRAAQNFKTEEEYNTWMMTEGWKNVPIYVMTEDGKRLPLVNAFKDGKNASRELIYKIYKSGLTPVARAVKRFDNGDIRFKKDSAGKPVFYDLQTLFSGTEEEVMQKIRDSIVYAGFKDNTFVWKTDKLTAVKDIKGGEATIGQIGIMLKDPNGGLKIVTLSTRNLSDVQSAVEAAMKSLKTEGLGFENFRKIVGTNEIELLDETQITEGIEDEDLKKQLESNKEEDREKFLMIETLGSTRVKLLTFYSKSTKRFVRVNEEELRAGLAGLSGFRMQFIQFVMTEKGVRAETIISPDDASNKKILVENLEKELREIINKKKFQVDINTLKSDNSDFGFSISLNGQDEVEFQSYLHYLISDNALGTPRSEGSGTSSVLATDIEVDDNKSIYFDTGLKFRQLGSEENGPLPLKESIGNIMPGKRGDATPVIATPAAPVSDKKADIERLSNKTLKSPQGTINTGKLEEAVLPNTIIEESIAQDKDGNWIEVYINNPKLQGTLLARNGNYLFRAMQGRFFVIAKVGNFYLPFYISSAGTSGKNEGEWYPFFGFNNWLVKGSVGKKGEMEYSEKISEVQKLLNDNFRIPAKYFTQFGQITNGKGTPANPDKVFYDINTHVKYESWFVDFDRQKDNKYTEEEFVADRTGLNPKNVVNDGKGSADSWIKDVVALIEDAEKASKGIISNAELAALGQPSADVITDTVYNNFVDKNLVPDNILSSIADKVINRIPLSQRETAIFSGKTSEINEIIRQKAPVVTQPAATVPKVIDIVEQPAENSNADALKDTENIMNDILSDIFGIETQVQPVAETKTERKVTEEPTQGSLGFLDKYKVTPGSEQEKKLNEEYLNNPEYQKAAEEIQKRCNNI